MTQLSVNINKIATLRNARGKNNPDLLQCALDIINFGAQGITVHPRPDGRHIRREDVFMLAENITVELNIEGYPDPDFMALIKEVKPAQCTLVPDPPHVLTSNAGWKVAEHRDFLTDTVAQLKAWGVRSALFIDPNTLGHDEIALLKTIQTDRVELYTEQYAATFGTPGGAAVLDIYQSVAEQIHGLGIDMNAGHDLDLFNLRALIQAIPMIREVSIGHALICDALYYGLQETIKRYKDCLVNA